MLVQLVGENIVMIGCALFIAWILIEISGGAIESTLGISQVNNLTFDLFAFNRYPITITGHNLRVSFYQI